MHLGTQKEEKNEGLDMMMEQELASEKDESDEDHKTEVKKVYKLKFDIPEDVLKNRKPKQMPGPKELIIPQNPLKKIPLEIKCNS